jgi:hypothetical protein
MKKILFLFKNICPPFILKKYQKFKLDQLIVKRRKRNKKLNVKDVFTIIYKNKEWGGLGENLYSGTGSDDEVANAYIDFVKSFIKEYKIDSVADLGCGDFRVGSKIYSPEIKYYAVDVVEEVINQNKIKFAGFPNLNFYCLDIIKDKLPKAKLCLIRQVLQHLSNSEIISVLNKIREFDFTLITEHYPAFLKKPNKDKPHGFDTRVHEKSAVVLDKPPFLVPYVKEVLSVKAISYIISPQETIKTFLVRKW